MTLTDIRILKDHIGVPCLSISVPIDRVDKKINYQVLKRAIRKAKALINAQAFSDETKNRLITELDRCSTQLPEQQFEGLGIFISPASSTIIPFPFEVKTKIVVDTVYELRDFLYLQQYDTPYYVLNLSKKGVHLYEGSLNELKEVKDNKFPLEYSDQFEYERASIANGSSSSLKSFEKDKHEIFETRLKAVFKEADSLLKARLTPDSKIVLTGIQRMISLFSAVTTLKQEVCGKVSGSYNENNFDKLRDFSWAAIVRAKNKEIERQVENLQEKNGHVVEGLQQTWNAAIEGKGLVLLVEKDLHHRAYRKEQEMKLHLHPPKKPYAVIPDAVDDLIKVVQSKNGKVLFTGNGQLKNFDHMAMVLRY